MYLTVGAFLAVFPIILVLSGCSAGTAGGSYVISASGGVTASAGTLSNSGGTWTFDAGAVPQYTTESITFTVKNTGSAAFTAQGTVNFTNSDFAANIGGTFTVPAGSSNTFVGSFTPTNSSGQETGTLTLTPTSGSPIVISLKGTADQAFQVFDTHGSPIQVTNTSTTSMPISIPNSSYQFTIKVVGSSTTTLTSSPNVVVSGAGSSALSVVTQPVSSTVTSSAPQTFDLQGSVCSPAPPATVTIAGTDSANTTGGFTFSFQVYARGGC